MEQSRRQFLETSGTIVGAGAIASLAGCTGILGSDGGGGGALGGYGDWLYAPGTIRDGDHYGFSGRAPMQVHEYEDELEEEQYDSMESGFESNYDFLDLDYDEVEAVVSFDQNTGTVLSGYQIPTEDVVESLEDNEFEEDGEYQGYQLYVRGDQQLAAGVGGSEIVIGRSTTMTGGSGNDVQGNGESGSEQDLRSISYGESWQGEIDESDPEGYNGYYEPVTFQGTAGDVVTIDMYADDDTYLYLLDPEGQEVAHNDDYEGLDSRIVQYELQQTGEYTIVATSYSSFDLFTYTLTLTLEGSPIDPVGIVESIVDTSNGEETRYADDSEAFATLQNNLNAGTTVTGRTHEEYDETEEESGRFEGAVGWATSATINGETAEIQQVIAFDDPDDIDTGDVEDWTEEAEDGGSFEDVDDISVSSSGRAAIITGTIDTDDL